MPDDGNIFQPITNPNPALDPEIVAAEVRGIRARIPRDPAGDALLSEPLAEELTRLVQEGQTLDNAARVCGLRRTTLSAWLRKGQADVEAGIDSPEARLTWAVDEALGVQETVLVRGAMRGVKVDAKHALEVLGRRRPADWAPAAPKHEDWRQAYASMSEGDLKAEIQRLLSEGKKEGESNG